ncbi:hypothetical protein GVN24_33980 [Rhizobium sp. CRIBSB]|nr:hypothetical protein [Rhizobium sp. CRIBSB]
MDAVTAAKDRIDKALGSLERKILDLKARAAGVSGADDDLFAPLPSSADAAARIAELEAAAAEAAGALARAAEAVRDTLAEAEGRG